MRANQLCPHGLHGLEDAFYDALSGGKASGNFRLRYENVDITSPTLKTPKPSPCAAV